MTNIHIITAQKAHDLLNARKAVLIDVREPTEYTAERISGAINLPLSKISAEDMAPYSDIQKKILFHCVIGKRSLSACEKVISACDFDLYSIEGGINSWKEEGFPTETS
ncbi:MAG: rhodanese-like domain-containing protein [bacterium]|nr:rhodanese-like domain-containing protein [bacterium]